MNNKRKQPTSNKGNTNQQANRAPNASKSNNNTKANSKRKQAAAAKRQNDHTHRGLFYNPRRSAGSHTVRSDQSLLEQIDEKKKFFQPNLVSEIQRLEAERKDLSKKLGFWSSLMETNREYVRTVLQTKEQLRVIDIKLTFLKSGQCNKLLEQRIQELSKPQKLHATWVSEPLTEKPKQKQQQQRVLSLPNTYYVTHQNTTILNNPNILNKQ